MLKLTGLWKYRDRNNNDYLSGSIGPNVKVLVFQNGNKKDEKDPDFVLYLAEPRREGDKQNSGETRITARSGGKQFDYEGPAFG